MPEERLTFGEYEVLAQEDGNPKVLGEGTSGTTFLGVLREEVFGQTLETFVALKVIKPGRLDSRGKQGQFFRELKVLSMLSHPNVVRYLRQGRARAADGAEQIWYAMEFCGGGNLEEHARKRGGIPEGELVGLALQAAAGLRAVHEVGFAHCDVKPSNLLLDQMPGRKASLVKISDFGSVQELKDRSRTLSAEVALSGEPFRGSPLFASPEQLREHRLDERSDAYSLGITLWYLLLGDRPFVGGLPEVHQWHLGPESHEPFLPSLLHPDLRRLLSRMVEKDPWRRVSGMDEVEECLMGVSEAMRSGPAVVASPTAQKKLEDIYRVDFARREATPLGNRFQAVDLTSGQMVVLVFVHPDHAGRHQVEEYLRKLVSDLRNGEVPPAVARPRAISRFGEDLVVASQHLGRLTLQDVVARRGGVLSFSEALVFMSQVARAIDFLVQRGARGFSVRMHDLHVRLLKPDGQTVPDAQVSRFGGRITTDSGIFPRILVDPLHHPPPTTGAGMATRTSVMIDATGTVMGTIRSEDGQGSGLEPQLEFVALLYRLIVGHEVPEAARLTPSAFTPTQRLGDQSNALVRDLLARTFEPIPSCIQILQELCEHEGVLLPEDPGVVPADTQVAVAPEARLVAEMPGQVVSPFGSFQTFPVPGPDWVAGRELRCPETGKMMRLPSNLPPLRAGLVEGSAGRLTTPYCQPAAVFDLIDHNEWTPGNMVTCPYTGRPLVLPSELPEWTMTGQVDPARPGLAASPYASGAMVPVPGAAWSGGGRVTCRVTGKTFLLPAVLPPLLGDVLVESPGQVRSPYAPTAPAFRVPEGRWKPGETVVCPSTGREIRLPADLPSIEEVAVVDEGKPGVARGPGGVGEPVTVPPEQWRPSNRLVCPGSSLLLRLPSELPPLDSRLVEGRALAVVLDFVGLEVNVAPIDWVAGAVLRSPETGLAFRLPTALPAPEGQIARPGFARSPFTPGAEPVRVAPENWRPGAEVLCPATGRRFVLPAALPSLEAELCPDRPGFIVSPFDPQQTPREVPGPEWKDGAEIPCPATGRSLTLPPGLPPLTARTGRPGRRVVVSPYDPARKEIETAARDWRPGGMVTCPATGRTFRMPESLPPVTAALDAKHPGRVLSPYLDGEAGQRVDPADWTPGTMVRCGVTGMDMVLPASLPALEAVPVPDAPGKVRSPYAPEGDPIEVDPVMWSPGTRLTCPATGNPVVLPPELPPLMGLLVPHKTDRVYSPYQKEPVEVVVSPQDWVPGKRMACPATGREMILPMNLPLREGRLNPDRIGFVHSPYAEVEVEVKPEDWMAEAVVRCPSTGQAFRLPERLPPLPGKTDDQNPGSVRSPYAEEAPPIELPPDRWKPGKVVLCPVTNREFSLPADLPPLRAILVDGKPGFIISPYDRTQRPHRVPGLEWSPGMKVKCPPGNRLLALPTSLPPLEARVSKSGRARIHSPYDPQEREVDVAPEDWRPSKLVRCPVTGRAMVMPPDLPGLRAALVPARPGRIASPYVSDDREFEVAPADWKPGRRMTCPRSGIELELPDDLPPLEALFDAATPGMVRSPYAPEGDPIVVAAAGWVPGGRIVCPVTGHPLVLPASLPPLPAVCLPDRPGWITSPFDRTGKPFAVASADWSSGTIVTCPATRRLIVLPAELPLLQGAIDAVSRGVVRSPFAPVDVMVSPADWEGGKVIRCPRTGRDFRLPPELPPLDGRIPSLQPGSVLSPYVENGEPVVVRPEDWRPGVVLECAATGRKFRLPAELPPLPARLVPDRPGWVSSPFDPDNKPFEVPGPDWCAGQTVTCPATGRLLALPADLPALEAIIRPDGRPVLISPYNPHGGEITVEPTDWRPGCVLRCPATGRDLIMPAKLPPLDAQPVPERPGWIFSPYDEDETGFSVDPREWNPGGEVTCPLSGLPARLPADLPALEALVDTSFPGTMKSPYDRIGGPVLVSPADWVAGGRVRCPASGRPLVLPESLPPLTALPAGTPGFVRSPFAPNHEPIRVSGVNWMSGAPVRCPATGRPLVLPPSLPPMEAAPGRGRTVRSPYDPEGRELPVSPEEWRAGRVLRCPVTGREMVMPHELPALQAIVEKSSPGRIKTPYLSNADPIDVPPAKWKPGTAVACRASGMAMKLPNELPPLLAGVDAARPGFATTPYDQNAPPFPVAAEEWFAGSVIICPTTGRSLVLGPDLAVEVALVDARRPGWVAHPIRPDDWIQVDRELWKPSGAVAYGLKGAALRLPAALPSLPMRRATKILILVFAVLALLAAAGVVVWLVSNHGKRTAGGREAPDRAGGWVRLPSPHVLPPAGPLALANFSEMWIMGGGQGYFNPRPSKTVVDALTGDGGT